MRLSSHTGLNRFARISALVSKLLVTLLATSPWCFSQPTNGGDSASMLFAIRMKVYALISLAFLVGEPLLIAETVFAVNCWLAKFRRSTFSLGMLSEGNFTFSVTWGQDVECRYFRYEARSWRAPPFRLGGCRTFKLIREREVDTSVGKSN